MGKQGDSRKKSKKNKTLHGITYLSQIGITMVVSVFIGVMIGRFLDNIFGTSPWLLLIFSLLGAGAAIKTLFDMSANKK